MNNYNLSDNSNRVMSLYSPSEGYMRGNLFPELYSPYKNYNPAMIKAQSEQSKMLLEIGQMTFASHDLNLYLDIHPDDNSMLTLFNDYREKANSLIKDYETKYGPINISSNSLDASPFLWEKDPWPFEGGSK